MRHRCCSHNGVQHVMICLCVLYLCGWTLRLCCCMNNLMVLSVLGVRCSKLLCQEELNLGRIVTPQMPQALAQTLCCTASRITSSHTVQHTDVSCHAASSRGGSSSSRDTSLAYAASACNAQCHRLTVMLLWLTLFDFWPATKL